MTRPHGIKLHLLVSKLRSGTFKTKAGALFWKSHCATCSPVYVILYHVTGSCKGPIIVQLRAWLAHANVLKYIKISLAFSEDLILKRATGNYCSFFCLLDLAILCCNLSEDSLHAVMEILQVIVPKQNLSAHPHFENFPVKVAPESP